MTETIPTPTAPRLIVNADDFGLSEPVNAGIVTAHRRGIVTATSLMAVGSAFDDAVRWSRALPTLDIGVHLTAVGGRALLPQSPDSPWPSGRFPDGYGAFVHAWLAGRIRPAAVHAEWSAQIERVLGAGIQVSHLDSHQHLHALPGLAERAFELAQRYRIPFVRVPLERPLPRPEGAAGLVRALSALVLRGAWTAARVAGGWRVRGRAARRRPRGLRFLGFSEGGKLDLDRLLKLLARIGSAGDYELMCHPGFTPAEPEVRRWNYRHESEVLALTHPAVRATLVRRGIRLCRFADLERERS